MSRGRHDGELIELSLRLRDLHITVSGPPDSATRFVHSVASLDFSSRDSPSEEPFEFVEPVSSASVDSTSRARSRGQIEASFESCPDRLLDLSRRIPGSVESAESRARRAWKAGQWAKAVAAKEIAAPDRTPVLELRNRAYAVLVGKGVTRPSIFKSAASYWKAVGTFGEDFSVSQAFPSELEARIYLESAGHVGEVEVLP